MNDDHPLAVGRILDFDLTGLDDEQSMSALTGPKDDFAVRVVAGRRERLDESDFRIVSRGNAASLE